jgi:uncharacterized membrane protein HdeD (DUF308 family)
MMNATVQVARRHWWLLLLRGILAILFGIIALAAPGIALLAFIYVFAAYAIVDGIAAIAISFQERRFLRTWWVLLLEGLAGLLFGILAFTWPGETALVLLYLLVAGGSCATVMASCSSSASSCSFFFHKRFLTPLEAPPSAVINSAFLPG